MHDDTLDAPRSQTTHAELAPPAAPAQRGTTQAHAGDTSHADDAPRGLNISRWALEHPELTRYLMIVLMVLGFAAFFQLGQD